MRSERFDRLARGLATRHTRRHLLAGAAGIALATSTHTITSPFTPTVSAELICPPGDPTAICPGTLDHAIIATRLLQSLPATAHSGCAPGNAPCEHDDACCSGVCTMHGRCGCFETGHLCPDDGYCCNGSCVNGRCA
jgi:hypothetical protein